LATAAPAAPAKRPPPPIRSKRNIVFPIIPGGGARLMKQIACGAVERIANKVYVAGFPTVLARRIGFWPDDLKGARHRGRAFCFFGCCGILHVGGSCRKIFSFFVRYATAQIPFKLVLELVAVLALGRLVANADSLRCDRLEKSRQAILCNWFVSILASVEVPGPVLDCC